MIRLYRRFACFSSVRERIKMERQTRLGKVNQNILPVSSAQSLANIRNIGIIAHIDAGKTTTTERMLYYAGALPSPGQIDQGTTTMDYMKQERQRGITIRSAAISFNWKKTQINLIDTPGHVDFSGQVARSLRVLDGAVTILDGVKGVQAQTIKVWEQASRRGIPKLCFINKMDRIGSSILRTAQAIQKSLKTQPLLFQIPIGQGQTFKGVIDLLQMKSIIFKGKYGEQLQISQIKQDNQYFEQSKKKRSQLIEKIANYDDIIGDLYLKEEKISIKMIKQAVRRILNNANLHNKICPIFIGAAYKNKGVQTLLDAVIDYLPSPTERLPVVSKIDDSVIRKPIKNQRFSAYTFKVIYDKQLGPLAYTRIYSGQLKKNSNIFNSSKGESQKLNTIYRVRANQYVPLNEISAGDIAAISGLKQTRAGQTLTQAGDNSFVLQKLQLPTAIFTMPLQLKSKSKHRQFSQAIKRIILQDNSLQYKQQIQTGQFLISGLGQLHLQIVKQKLIEEGIDVKLGKLKINYKQTIIQAIKKSLKLKNILKNDNYQEFQLEVEIVPLKNQQDKIQQKINVVFNFDKVDGFDANWRQFMIKKQGIRHSKRNEDETKESFTQSRLNTKKSIHNPTPNEPLQEQIEEQQQDKQQDYLIDDDGKDHQSQQSQEAEEKGQQNEPYYHINTLPFETLYQLVQICRVALLSGCHNYPMMGVQLRIGFGKFQKKHFSKTIMNKTASQLVRQLLNSSTLLEPFLQFRLSGQAKMIDIVTSDIIKKRGRIHEQKEDTVQGVIPASAVRGWLKQLRAMGLNIEMKLSTYQYVMGIDPKKLLQQNS